MIAVYCPKPLTMGEARPVISAEEAWNRLLEGEGVVYIEDHILALPAARFKADASRVTDARLVTVPE